MTSNQIESEHLVATVGAKAAMHGRVVATFTIEYNMTRRFIWMMKLRTIWAIIRAKGNFQMVHPDR